jgi:hypothetical protein
VDISHAIDVGISKYRLRNQSASDHGTNNVPARLGMMPKSRGPSPGTDCDPQPEQSYASATHLSGVIDALNSTISPDTIANRQAWTSVSITTSAKALIK